MLYLQSMTKRKLKQKYSLIWQNKNVSVIRLYVLENMNKKSKEKIVSHTRYRHAHIVFCCWISLEN